jgi:hypothetical protein
MLINHITLAAEKSTPHQVDGESLEDLYRRAWEEHDGAAFVRWEEEIYRLMGFRPMTAEEKASHAAMVDAGRKGGPG